MKIAPLQLERYFVSELHFTVNHAFDPGREPVVKSEHFCAESVPVKDKENPTKWQIALRLKHQPDAATNSPYAFTVEIVGFFEVTKSFPDDHKDRLARTNGLTILYGIAREVVRSVTSSGPYPGILIPSVSFFEPINKTQKQTTGSPESSHTGEATEHPTFSPPKE